MVDAEVLGLGVSIGFPVISGAVLWGKMNARLQAHEKAMDAKVDRAEFGAGMKRLDELHRDLREIRDLLMKVLADRGAS